MLIGGTDFASFQPSELYKLAEACGTNSHIVDNILAELRPFLIPTQKRKPYELLTGYYNISFKTLADKTKAIIDIYTQFIKSL